MNGLTASTMTTLLFGAVFGCRSSPSRADARAETSVEGTPASECVPRIEEKIGVRFVRVCPSESTTGPETAPFWISVVPMGCSAGEHETIRCPPVIALAQPRASDPSRFPAASAQLAAIVESDTAHSICTMRFAGRLPTQAERALSRAALGLSTVLVTESGEVSRYHVQEVAEWVTEMACDQPVVLAPRCGVRAFPADATRTVPWEAVRRCDPTPVTAVDSRMTFGIDGECPAGRASADGSPMRAVPCILQGPAADPRGRRDAAISLVCGSSGPAPARLRELVPDVAAFRCVLDQWH